jgi:hypothetical protein
MGSEVVRFHRLMDSMSTATVDLLVYNARVHTMDAQVPTATAFGVRERRFAAVGRTESLLQAAPEAPRLDAGGHTIVPGFIDAHAHLHALGLSLCRADLAGAPSPSAVVERLRAYATEDERPGSRWLRGHGWDQTRWTPPRLPCRSILDAAFPERPVWLTRTDVHAGWANTAALKETVGLDRLAAMDAPPGGRICRDEAGRPTGVLVDAAMALIEDHIPPPDDAHLDRALSTALDHTARHGLTGLHDAGVDLAGIRRIRRRIEDGRFPLRVYAMMDGRAEAFAHFCDAGPLHHPSGRLTVESVKFFADGALGSRGAALLEPYADAPNNRGLLLHNADAFREAVTAVVGAGFQVNTHAIGDRANRFVLDAYAVAARAGTRPLRRPRIEHAQVMHPRDRARLGDLGVVASVQPGFARSDQSWAPDRLGPERLSYAYAWSALQNAGAPLAFGSDAPVDPISPLRGFFAAVAPPSVSSDDAHPLTAPLNRRTALHAYTQGAAYAAFQEDEVGSITPGKRADFAVLSDDLLAVPMAQIPNLSVRATYLGGRPTYTHPSWPPA